VTRNPRLYGSRIFTPVTQFMPTGVTVQFGATTQTQQNQDYRLAFQSDNIVDIYGYYRISTPSGTGAMFLNMTDIPQLDNFIGESFNYILPLGIATAIDASSGDVAKAYIYPNASATQFYFGVTNTATTPTIWTNAVPWTWAAGDEFHITMRYPTSIHDPFGNYD